MGLRHCPISVASENENERPKNCTVPELGKRCDSVLGYQALSGNLSVDPSDPRASHPPDAYARGRTICRYCGITKE